MLFYRKELDGLRALAVMAVIIYHANLNILGVQLFQGGFFGVDIFFVLSGYLITGIVRSQMGNGTFTFRDFYWRRAKRIIPALVTMLLVTTGFAYLILLPDDLVTYAQSLQSALYFGSNYFFYGEDSYISDASIYKPLLHTWSLAVEWQFYIIYPVIAWFIHRFFKQYMFGILLVSALFSLQYSQFIVKNYPDMAFYLLPSRAWELLLGGLITFYNRDRFLKAKEGSLELIIYKGLPVLGMFLIMHSLIFINHDIHHPSFLTLTPVIGTCLFIMFAHRGEVMNDLFSIKPLVYIGLISYPLYLWHQPVFVFFRIIRREIFRNEQFILLVIISTVLAYITYKFIEGIYRKKRVSKKLSTLLIALVAGLFIFSYLVISHVGYPERLQGKIKDAYDMYQGAEYRRLLGSDIGKSYLGREKKQCNMRTPDTSCEFGDKSWITIGDSYVGQYEYALLEMLIKNNKGLISLSHEQCPFVDEKIWFGSVPTCSLANKDRWIFLNKLKTPRKVLLAANYDQFLRPKKQVNDPIQATKDGFKGGEKIKADIAWLSYAKNINELLKRGHEVYVVYPVPEPGMDVKKKVFQQLKTEESNYELTFSTDNESYSRAESRSKKLNTYLPEHPNLHKIYPKDILCENKRCKVIDNTGGLFNGGRHLSYLGAQKILSTIPGLFEKNPL